MRYTEKRLNELREAVRSRISEKRYSHTLSVERTALEIGSLIGYAEPDMLSAAAILHDIAKEIPVDDQISMLRCKGFDLTEEDIESPEILHSFVGAFVFSELGEEYYDPSVANAISEHTVGSEDMSLISMIIFISDYIEETRQYPICREMRKKTFDMLSAQTEDAERALAKICIQIIENTVCNLRSGGKSVNSRMLNTEKSLLGKYFQK